MNYSESGVEEVSPNVRLESAIYLMGDDPVFIPTASLHYEEHGVRVRRFPNDSTFYPYFTIVRIESRRVIVDER